MRNSAEEELFAKQVGDTYKKMFNFMESRNSFVNSVEAGINRVRNSYGKIRYASDIIYFTVLKTLHTMNNHRAYQSGRLRLYLQVLTSSMPLLRIQLYWNMNLVKRLVMFTQLDGYSTSLDTV